MPSVYIHAYWKGPSRVSVLCLKGNRNGTHSLQLGDLITKATCRKVTVDIHVPLGSLMDLLGPQNHPEKGSALSGCPGRRCGTGPVRTLSSSLEPAFLSLQSRVERIEQAGKERKEGQRSTWNFLGVTQNGSPKTLPVKEARRTAPTYTLQS